MSALLCLLPFLTSVRGFARAGTANHVGSWQERSFHMPMKPSFGHHHLPAQYHSTMTVLLYAPSDDSFFSTKDPFAILGVDASADKTAIKRAYKRAALKYHPDMVVDKDASPDEKKRASDRFAKINWAYGELSQGENSQKYNLWTPPSGASYTPKGSNPYESPWSSRPKRHWSEGSAGQPNNQRGTSPYSRSSYNHVSWDTDTRQKQSRQEPAAPPRAKPESSASKKSEEPLKSTWRSRATDCSESTDDHFNSSWKNRATVSSERFKEPRNRAAKKSSTTASSPEPYRPSGPSKPYHTSAPSASTRTDKRSNDNSYTKSARPNDSWIREEFESFKPYGQSTFSKTARVEPPRKEKPDALWVQELFDSIGQSYTIKDDKAFEGRIGAVSVQQIRYEMHDTERVVPQLALKLELSQKELKRLSFDKDVADKYWYMDSCGSNELLLELEARHRALKEFVKSAQRRLAALQTRHAELVLKSRKARARSKQRDASVGFVHSTFEQTTRSSGSSMPQVDARVSDILSYSTSPLATESECFSVHESQPLHTPSSTAFNSSTIDCICAGSNNEDIISSFSTQILNVTQAATFFVSTHQKEVIMAIQHMEDPFTMPITAFDPLTLGLSMHGSNFSAEETVRDFATEHGSTVESKMLHMPIIGISMDGDLINRTADGTEVVSTINQNAEGKLGISAENDLKLDDTVLDGSATIGEGFRRTVKPTAMNISIEMPIGQRHAVKIDPPINTIDSSVRLPVDDGILTELQVLQFCRNVVPIGDTIENMEIREGTNISVTAFKLVNESEVSSGMASNELGYRAGSSIGVDVLNELVGVTVATAIESTETMSATNGKPEDTSSLCGSYGAVKDIQSSTRSRDAQLLDFNVDFPDDFDSFSQRLKDSHAFTTNNRCMTRERFEKNLQELRAHQMCIDENLGKAQDRVLALQTSFQDLDDRLSDRLNRQPNEKQSSGVAPVYAAVPDEFGCNSTYDSNILNKQNLHASNNPNNLSFGDTDRTIMPSNIEKASLSSSSLDILSAFQPNAVETSNIRGVNETIGSLRRRFLEEASVDSESQTSLSVSTSKRAFSRSTLFAKLLRKNEGPREKIGREARLSAAFKSWHRLDGALEVVNAVRQENLPTRILKACFRDDFLHRPVAAFVHVFFGRIRQSVPTLLTFVGAKKPSIPNVHREGIECMEESPQSFKNDEAGGLFLRLDRRA
jgi:curved DNA-binding protein CbpA